MKKTTFILFSFFICIYANANMRVEPAITEGSHSTLVPQCAILLSPSNGETGVIVNADMNNLITLNWTAPLTGDTVAGYNIYFGQHANEMYFIGSTPDYTFSIDGIFKNTTYYWQVIPVGLDGQAEGCDVWSFTTESSAPIVPDYVNNFSIEDDGWHRATGPVNGQITKVVTNDWNYFEFANQSDGPNGFAGYINMYNRGLPTYNWLISPLLDLSTSPLYLNFDIALTSFADPSEGAFTAEEFVALMVSEDDGLTWTELERWDENSNIDYNGQAAQQRTLTQTGNTRFAFYAYTSENSLNNVDFFVDNFSITQNLTVIDQEKIALTFYPNPVVDYLNISTTENIKDVTIYNLLGQQVLHKTVNGLGSTLDLSGLPAGNYIARVNTSNAVKSVKLIKK